jgi:hypothetical protein
MNLMNKRLQTARANCQAFLDELMELLPLARELGRLEEWSNKYTTAYMLKLRTMQ